MKSDILRRVLIYGTGVIMGAMIVLIMNQVDEQVPRNKEVNRIVVSISKCDLNKGAVLEDACVESRAVEKQFIPPATMTYERRKLFLGQKLNTEIKKGSAFREVDFVSTENDPKNKQAKP